MALDTTHFKKKLEEELVTLEGELTSVGQKNPDNLKDWEAKPADLNALSSDESELADTQEEFEGNTAILKRLEVRFNDVKKALEKIGNGTYGICETSGEPIETERLEANPAARTCMKHLGTEK